MLLNVRNSIKIKQRSTPTYRASSALRRAIMIKTTDLDTLEPQKRSPGRPRKAQRQPAEERRAYMRDYQSRPERRAYQREYARRKRAEETATEREERLAYDRLYQAERRANESAEQRLRRLEAQRRYRARKRSTIAIDNT